MPVAQLRTTFADPPTDCAPMMRWWWFGPAVDRTELDRELTAMVAAGIGGVEVAYVYPLGPATTTFCAPDFLADLRWAAERARELGLRFDLTLGSGWSFGGPHITPDLAARGLHWERREIQPGPLPVPVVAPWPDDELVAAYVGDGIPQETPERCIPLPVEDGMIMVPDGTGTRQVLLCWSRRTGQNVKRAAAGAEGPVLDHYSAAATEAHLRTVGDPLLDAVPAELVGSVFCDSLEVYHADWTPDLVAEFTRRRGYDPLPQLYLLAVDGPDAHRFRADYHQTLAELYQDRFVAPIQRWAAGRGVPFRIQGYGTPPATISSYRYADLFEGEGWGWTEITQTRWASSAAHSYGRPVVSAEVWTWVHSPSFRATPLDLKGEAHEHLLAGVNQLIGHGWPYSPADAPGLGWFFYAAGALDDRNPWWPAMPRLAEYLTRLCWLTRQGDPVADVLVYVPTRDVFAQMGVATGGTLDAWRQTARMLGDSITRTIRTGGWDYDLVDDDALSVTAPDSVRAVVLPPTVELPDGVRDWLDRVSAAGGSVIMVDDPVDTDALRDRLAAAVPPDARVDAATDIGVVHRRTDDADLYLVVNTGAQQRAFTFAPRAAAEHPDFEEWDAETGGCTRSGPVGEGIDITLEPYQATVIVLTAFGEGAAETLPAAVPDRTIELSGPWQIAFADGPVGPVQVPHAWEDDPDRAGYSGAATYRTVVELPEQLGSVMIDFGATAESAAGSPAEAGIRGHSYRAMIAAPVREVAVVRVNGVDCGITWAPPYRLDLTSAVRPGTNDIEITVHNTGANRLGHDQHIHALAEQSERQYGRRFRMQELDRATETVRSGLLAVPSIMIMR